MANKKLKKLMTEVAKGKITLKEAENRMKPKVVDPEKAKEGKTTLEEKAQTKFKGRLK